VYFVIFVLYAISLRVRRSQAYLDHKKHRDMKDWLRELQGPQQLLLFCNASAAENLSGKSVIAFNTRQVFFFSRTREAGACIQTTYVRLSHADLRSPLSSSSSLELKTVVQVQGLLDAVSTEVIQRIPIEPQHVAQLRGWLQLHQEVFNFEMPSENQDVQLGAIP
jgi:hypothetical protein